MGLAFCAPGELFSRYIGRQIAEGRARQCYVRALRTSSGAVHAPTVITHPELLQALVLAEWLPFTPPRQAFVAPFMGFRLPRPRPIPTHPLFRNACETGEIGTTENARWIEIHERPHRGGSAANTQET